MATFAQMADTGLDGLAGRVEIVIAGRQHQNFLACLATLPGREVKLPAVLAGWDDT